MTIEPAIIDWLMAGDTAIRWQVMRDILQCDMSLYEQERGRMTHCGWAAKLLSLQDENGLWNRSLYNGKWISTPYTLYLLKLLGLPPRNAQALRACDQLIGQGLYRGQEIRFSRNQSIRDNGVSALILSLCSYFEHGDKSLVDIARFLIQQQRDDGSWLTNDSPTNVPYAFDTTLLVLEALLRFRQSSPGDDLNAIAEAETKGRAFLLAHSLFLNQGKPIKAKWTSFAFPPYWFYDVLTALDYFQSSGFTPDERLQPAIQLLLKRRLKNGAWPRGRDHPGKTYFQMEERGDAGRWNTLRALRVLRWWDRRDKQ